MTFCASSSAKMRTESMVTAEGGKRSRSVTIRFLLTPMSQSPDQPATAAPKRKMRVEPRKKGSEKESMAPKGTVSTSRAEKIYRNSEKLFLAAATMRLSSRARAKRGMEMRV